MSSCVAVDDWTTTLWGGEVGTRRGRSQRAALASRQVVQQHSTAQHSRGPRTRLADKHFLWRAAGTLPHGVVDAEADLVALVFAQICEGEREERNPLSVRL